MAAGISQPSKPLQKVALVSSTNLGREAEITGPYGSGKLSIDGQMLHFLELIHQELQEIKILLAHVTQ